MKRSKRKTKRAKKNPFISIIIPTLNEEKNIGFVLRALRNQDYEGKYEIIVADSYSEDKTVKIAKKYADKVVLESKRSVSAGRNAGAREAKGEILVFLDADTYVLPNFLQVIEKSFKDRKVIGVQVAIISEAFGYLIHHLISSLLHEFSFLAGYPIVSTVAFACRRDAFWKVGGFNEEMKLTEDIDLGLRLAKYARQNGKILIYTRETMVLTSSRRLKRLGVIRFLAKWPFGYIHWKLRGKLPSYEPVRE